MYVCLALNIYDGFRIFEIMHPEYPEYPEYPHICDCSLGRHREIIEEEDKKCNSL